jgi:hypothetical protein
MLVIGGEPGPGLEKEAQKGHPLSRAQPAPPPLSPERPLKGTSGFPSFRTEWVLPLPDERSLSEKGPSFDSYQQGRGKKSKPFPFSLHRVSMVEGKFGPPKR